MPRKPRRSLEESPRYTMCERCKIRRTYAYGKLCWVCGAEQGNKTKGKKATQPSNQRPGTPGKIVDLMERAARGEELFHPKDLPMDPELLE